MPEAWYGYNAPFLGGTGNVLSRQSNDRLVKNDLLQLLLTAPGERVMRPGFGSGIRPFLFQQMTTEALDELRDNIINTIVQYEPRVNVSDVVLDTDEDNSLLRIKVYGTFGNAVPANTVSELLIEFGLPTNEVRQTGAGVT